jgi:hypothetical protein
MAYARVYTVDEVKGMLMIIESSQNVTITYTKGKFKGQHPPAAHSGSLHAGKTQADLSNRAVAEAKSKTSSYKDFDTMVLATTEALNSPQGQLALARLDPPTSANDATFNAPLAGNKYYASRVSHNVKSGAVTNEPYMIASEAFVKVCKYIAGKLWIQTSFPSQCNARPTPSLADLP